MIKFTLCNLDNAVLSKAATIHFQYSARQYCYQDGNEQQSVDIPNSVFCILTHFLSQECQHYAIHIIKAAGYETYEYIFTQNPLQ